MELVLTVGANYVAKQEGYTDLIDFGNGPEVITYPTQERRFKVLPKPGRVIADDGHVQESVNTPAHLMSDDCYWVKSLVSGRCFWFFVNSWDSISPA